MDLLFASNSPFNWVAEKNFARLKEEQAANVAAIEASQRIGHQEGLEGKGKGEVAMEENM